MTPISGEDKRTKVRPNPTETDLEAQTKSEIKENGDDEQTAFDTECEEAENENSKSEEKIESKGEEWIIVKNVKKKIAVKIVKVKILPRWDFI